MTPTQRTLKNLRENGWIVQVVERWNSFARIRQDLFGCIDIVAVKGDSRGVFGVQATSGNNVAARIQKSVAEPKLRAWLQAGNRFAVVGWSKRGPRGKVKRWEPRWQEIDLATLDRLTGNSDSGMVRMRV